MVCVGGAPVRLPCGAVDGLLAGVVRAARSGLAAATAGGEGRAPVRDQVIDAILRLRATLPPTAFPLPPPSPGAVGVVRAGEGVGGGRVGVWRAPVAAATTHAGVARAALPPCPPQTASARARLLVITALRVQAATAAGGPGTAADHSAAALALLRSLRRTAKLDVSLAAAGMGEFGIGGP